jgi:hypothetical protein
MSRRVADRPRSADAGNQQLLAGLDLAADEVIARLDVCGAIRVATDHSVSPGRTVSVRVVATPLPRPAA